MDVTKAILSNQMKQLSERKARRLLEREERERRQKQFMTQQEYEERQKRICRGEWFKDHVAHRHDYLAASNIGYNLQLMFWRKPGTSNYAMQYIISGRSLIIIGDTGDAVFEWGERITWDFLNGCDLHYFAEKCRASEAGTRFKHWHSQIAGHGCTKMLNEWGAGVDTLAAVGEAITSDRREFEAWLSSQWNTNRGDDFIRQLDPEQMSALLESGDVLHPRLIGMWVGIKMACEQLSK